MYFHPNRGKEIELPVYTVPVTQFFQELSQPEIRNQNELTFLSHSREKK